MQELRRVIALAAPHSAPVLISGETGTGKELAARTLHALSPRADRPFVAVNCAAVPDSLLESELFGHERGAFTGALARRAGYFELADGGTIFLDEITEMSPALQAKYLRVLENRIVRRVGGSDEFTVDVRIIAATNHEVASAVDRGKLREDLYYRLSVISLPIPPLRERVSDIPLLVDAFVAEANEQYHRRVRTVEEAAMRCLQAHSWPGNVRELRNVVQRAVIAAQDDRITLEYLRLGSRVEASNPGDTVVLPLGITLNDAQRKLTLRTLESVNGNKTRAARILGLTVKTLQNKLRRWQVDPPPGSAPSERRIREGTAVGA
jgi:DNA-binding NtrC family response regulator